MTYTHSPDGLAITRGEDDFLFLFNFRHAGIRLIMADTKPHPHCLFPEFVQIVSIVSLVIIEGRVG